MSFTSLPLSVFHLIAPNPRELCALVQVNKALLELLSDDKLWKPMFMYYRRYPYNKKEGVSWKAATLGINHKRYLVEYLFSRIYALTFKPIRNTFQRGVDPQYMKSLEERYSITLPTFLREYFMIVNGQGPFGIGFIEGLRLLSLEEALAEYSKRQRKGKYLSLVGSLVSVSSCMYPDNTIGIPLTFSLNFEQIVASEKTGHIYLESGWNAFNKAANWYIFLYDFMCSRVGALLV